MSSLWYIIKEMSDHKRTMNLRAIFEKLIFKLSSSQITVENSLERLIEMCETYILPDDTPVEKGKRKRLF